jgi:hypothetical protein
VLQSRVRAALPHQYDRHDYRSIADAYFSPAAASACASGGPRSTAQAESIVHLVVIDTTLPGEALEASDNNSDFLSMTMCVSEVQAWIEDLTSKRWVARHSGTDEGTL